MIYYAVLFFSAAAIGGIILAVKTFKNKPLPMPLSLIHGGLATAGLIMLIFGIAATAEPGNALIALIIFAVAALGGFALFSFHLRKKDSPKALVLIHGGAAVLAFMLLLIWILN
ncbi:MAG: hypothetical protein A2X62_12305 [Stygiobacter sp. GWC2_38_9]|nr:MAG: hypothetical protein A2X62_12305 [Stygiobacter sp. GWC2_38_9]